MKVLNLRCSRLHCFEGWFGSEDDFQSQFKRGLVECPVCADIEIQKMPSAPRLNLGGHGPSQADASTRDATLPPAAGSGKQLTKEETRGSAVANGLFSQPNAPEHAEFLAALRQVMATTEDVGPGFADEARRMHYGKAPARSIRGQASVRDALKMREEGIEIMALPILPASAETLQ